MCFHFLCDLSVLPECVIGCVIVLCVVIFNLLFDSSIYNFLSDIFLIRNGHVSDGGVKMISKCCFITVACISAVLNLPGYAFEGRKGHPQLVVRRGISPHAVGCSLCGVFECSILGGTQAAWGWHNIQLTISYLMFGVSGPKEVNWDRPATIRSESCNHLA